MNRVLGGVCLMAVFSSVNAPDTSAAEAAWTLASPDGSVADWVDAVVVTDKQGVVVDVPVAYNDPQGVWTVSATELYTGTTATARFTVK